MSLEALLNLMENAENPEEALKEHIAKQRSNAGNVNKNTCVTNKSLQNNEVTPVTPQKIQTLPKNTIRNNIVTPVTAVTPKKTLSEKNLAVTPEQINLEQANDFAREKRQAKVLKMLANHPDQKRAYATDAESDPDNVILTCAIRNMCTFELLISREKYDPFLLITVLHKDLLQ